MRPEGNRSDLSQYLLGERSRCEVYPLLLLGSGLAVFRLHATNRSSAGSLGGQFLGRQRHMFSSRCTFDARFCFVFRRSDAPYNLFAGVVLRLHT